MCIRDRFSCACAYEFTTCRARPIFSFTIASFSKLCLLVPAKGETCPGAWATLLSPAGLLLSLVLLTIGMSRPGLGFLLAYCRAGWKSISSSTSWLIALKSMSICSSIACTLRSSALSCSLAKWVSS